MALAVAVARGSTVAAEGWALLHAALAKVTGVEVVALALAAEAGTLAVAGDAVGAAGLALGIQVVHVGVVKGALALLPDEAGVTVAAAAL